MISFLNLLLTLGALHNSKTQNDICDFDCWIRSLVIHVPPIPYDLGIFGEFNMTNIIIENISMDEIQATFYPNPTEIDDGLLFDITLSAYLQSDIHIKGPLFETNGNVTATIKDINIQLPIKFIKDNDGLISNVSVYDLDKCEASVNDVKITPNFDSSVIDFILSNLVPAIDLIIKNYAKGIVCNNIEPYIKDYGSSIFTTIGDYIRPYLNGSSSIEIPIDGSKMSDLRESQVIDLINFILTNLTTGPTPLNLNSLVNRFSKETGIFDYQDLASFLGLSSDLSFEIPIETDDIGGTISFSLKDFVIGGLNTWRDFSILDPISPFVLDTRTSLDKLDFNMTFTMNVSIEGLVESGNVELSESAFFHMNLANNSMDVLLQYAAEKGVGLNYTISQCMDPTCLMKLASPDGTGFKKFEFNTSIESIELESAEATLEEEIQETINTVCKFFISNYRSKIPVFLNGFLNEFGRSYLNDYIKNTLKNSECKPIKEEPYREFGVPTSIIGASFSLVALVVLVSLMLIVDYIRKNDEENKHEKFLTFFRTDSEASLFMHPKLPKWVRILIPFLICTCISLFLSSNGSIGASVFLKAHLGKYKKLEFPTVFDFALTKSIDDMWKAKAYILSMCVAVGSCVWPYTKLVLMLVVWIIPSTIISKKHRDRILRVLFVLGKWSLIDSYFMILTVVGFHFVIDFPIVHYETINDQNILYIWVYPAYGFITLIIGTIYSLALSHLVCYINRHVSNPYSSVDHSGEKKVSVFMEQNIASKILLIIFLPFAFTLFIAGISVNSFSFEFKGLTGWALDILDKVNKKGYTIIDMIPKFPQSCEYPNDVKNRIIQIIYVITAVVAPTLHIIFLSVMLFLPMTKKQLFSMYNACEVLYSWSCLDVFTVSIFISVVQISLLANFMVGDSCDLINVILKKFFAKEDYIEGNYKCFEIRSILEKGTFLLIAAALINTVAALWINAISRKVIEKGQETGDYTRTADPESLLNSENLTNENMTTESYTNEN